MRTIAIVNQKGGCGKTTTAINLAAVYARRGLRTLVVDLDPQAHCAAGLGVPESGIDYSIGEAMTADFELAPPDPARLAWQVARNLDLAPSTMSLAALEAPGGGLHELPDRDRRLERVLARLDDRYDRCLVDCPPTIGLLTFNAMRAAREVLVPVQTSYFAFKGAQKQWETLQRVIQRIGRPIACHMLPTMYDPESRLSRDILAAMHRQHQGIVLPISIGMHEELQEAQSIGQPITEHAPASRALADYEALADWLEDEAGVAPVEIDVDLGTGALGGRRPGDGARGAATDPSSDSMPDRGTGRAAELAGRLRTGPAPRPGEPTTGPTAPAHVPSHDPARRTGQVRVDPPRPSLLVEAEPETPCESGERVRHLYGATRTSRGVLFVQPASKGQEIAVAGDFNGWSPAMHRLVLNADLGVREALIDVPPGRHRYRLVIDGRWMTDEFNDEFETNAHGERHSIVAVPALRDVREGEP